MKLKTTILLAVMFLVGLSVAEAGWRKQTSNTLAWLRTVHFVDANTGWIGGSKGTLLKTVDGGRTWQKQPGMPRGTIRQIAFLDKRNGWILCERDIYSLGSRGASYLMKTADGGNSWTRVNLSNKRRQRITRLFFAKNGFGLAIGETGALFGLMDDNRSWQKLILPVSYLMTDGAFLDNMRGVVVGGGGTILFTEDAGTTWDKAFVAGDAPSKFNSVFFKGSKLGWAAGSDGRVFQTVNGGRTWRGQRSPTTTRLNDVYFLNSANGWAIGDDGVVLHTTTGGNRWTRIGVKSTHKLESIFFNGERGWIVGFGGTILTYIGTNDPQAERPRFRSRR